MYYTNCKYMYLKLCGKVNEHCWSSSIFVTKCSFIGLENALRSMKSHRTYPYERIVKNAVSNNAVGDKKKRL